MHITGTSASEGPAALASEACIRYLPLDAFEPPKFLILFQFFAIRLQLPTWGGSVHR